MLHKTYSFLAAFLLLFTPCALPSSGNMAQQPAPAYDLVITNAHVIDGTGNPWIA